MTEPTMHNWLFALLILMLLTACASQGVREGGDATGDLGSEKRESPADIYVSMGIEYLRAGQPAVALQKLKKGISIDPENAEAHNVIAILYERLGEIALADDHYAKAVHLQPQDPYIRNARGSFFCKQSDFVKAEQEFEYALANPLYPTPWVAMTNAGLCAEKAGDKFGAEKYYRRALTANGKYAPALFQMAELSFEQDNSLSARGYLERYNTTAASTPGSLWLGVQIERSLGNTRQANRYKYQLREKFPDAPEIQLLKQSELQ